MTQLGARPKVLFPRTYKGFRLIRSYGRVYGIPGFLDAEATARRLGELGMTAEGLERLRELLGVLYHGC